MKGKRERKTYGVKGYIDIQLRIDVGKARASVRFTGGAMTAYGVTPAEYTTSERTKQAMIENSRQFRSGRIMLLRREVCEEDCDLDLGGAPDSPTGTPAEVGSQDQTAPLSGFARNSGRAPLSGSALNSQRTAASAEYGTSAAAVQPLTRPVMEAGNADRERDEAGAAKTAKLTEEMETEAERVAVSCLTEAQEYLRDHFGIPTSRSRSKEKAQEFGRENGIVFVGL